jgi:hypothetical protein
LRDRRSRGPEKYTRHRIAIPLMLKITFDLGGFTAFAGRWARVPNPREKYRREEFFL